MSENVDLSMEKAHLADIVVQLQKELEAINTRVAEFTFNIGEAKKELWQNIYDIDPTEARRMRQMIGEEVDTANMVLDQQRRLQKLVGSPYFARIDFSCSENLQDMIYIGIFSFMDESHSKMLIYDWRAPISSMYYDFELGPCGYEAPDGPIDGEMILKRQYKVKNSEMEYMLESSININDDVLQRELSNTSDEKMKNIVATIQKEQNEIIRNENAQVLVIQGVAGSGKTSIALHRVAYFLYKYRKSLQAKNVLIISPNKVFADYISNVLPELGEEPIGEISMDEIADNEIEDPDLKYETFFDQVTYLLDHEDKEYIERIKFKAGLAFLGLLDAYIKHYQKAYFTPADIEIDDYFISKEFIESRYFAYQRHPVLKRMEETANDVFEKIQADKGVTLKKQSYNKIRHAVLRMFKFKTTMQVYNDFYKHIKNSKMFSLKAKNFLEHSDVFPYIYLKISFEGTRNFIFIKHLLIDEMQDYTPIQFAVINKLFQCKKTVLGDYGQAVNPYISQPLDFYGKIFQQMEYVQLFKSYRSTCEIINFAKRIKDDVRIETVERHGEEPEIIKCRDEGDQANRIAEEIGRFYKSRYHSLGVICRTQQMAKKLYERLQPVHEDIHYLDQYSKKFNEGITVTTVHMSKGLEFDQVILASVDSETYAGEMDSNLLYIGCTRAMHSLKLYYWGKITSFLE